MTVHYVLMACAKTELDTKDLRYFTLPQQASPLILTIPLKLIDFAMKLSYFNVGVTGPFTT